jgi:hypothetical protein
MAKGGASKDKKPAEKKGGDKGKGKPEEAADKGGKVRKHTGTAFYVCFVGADRKGVFRVKLG